MLLHSTSRCPMMLDAMTDAARTPPDTTPFAELIGRLTRANQELAAAAALWQERARFLGERLQSLEVGTIVPAGEMSGIPDSPQVRTVATEHDVASVRASERLIYRLRLIC
jgi:hypothetical protein